MGAAAGSGSGGGEGAGDDGGTDLVQIAGEILPSDYPRDLRERGIGGRVGVLLHCRRQWPSDELLGHASEWCSRTRCLDLPLIRERSSTARAPIHEAARSRMNEGEHDWIAASRYIGPPFVEAPLTPANAAFTGNQTAGDILAQACLRRRLGPHCDRRFRPDDGRSLPLARGHQRRPRGCPGPAVEPGDRGPADPQRGL